jgi:hypothetical protein
MKVSQALIKVIVLVLEDPGTRGCPRSRAGSSLAGTKRRERSPPPDLVIEGVLAAALLEQSLGRAPLNTW